MSQQPIEKRITNRGGLLRTVIFIVIILLVLSYFGFNIRAIVNSPAGQENFTYVQELMIKAWDGYLEKPVMYLWKDIFLDLIWDPAIENLKKLRDGQPDELQANAPKLVAPKPIPY